MKKVILVAIISLLAGVSISLSLPSMAKDVKTNSEKINTLRGRVKKLEEKNVTILADVKTLKADMLEVQADIVTLQERDTKQSDGLLYICEQLGAIDASCDPQ